MTMPKTAIDKDNSSIFLKRQIRCPEKATVIDTIAQPLGEEVATHNHFRLRVTPLDVRHAAASLFGGHPIGHLNAKIKEFPGSFKTISAYLTTPIHKNRGQTQIAPALNII